MLEFLQQTLNGLALGGIYALVALGYTMVYGVLKLINFAHGEVLMIGGMIGFFGAYALGLVDAPSPLALVIVILIAMMGCGMLGVLIERIAYRPLRRSPRLAALITAIGMSLFFQTLLQPTFTSVPYDSVGDYGPRARTARVRLVPTEQANENREEASILGRDTINVASIWLPAEARTLAVDVGGEPITFSIGADGALTIPQKPDDDSVRVRESADRIRIELPYDGAALSLAVDEATGVLRLVQDTDKTGLADQQGSRVSWASGVLPAGELAISLANPPTMALNIVGTERKQMPNFLTDPTTGREYANPTLIAAPEGGRPLTIRAIDLVAIPVTILMLAGLWYLTQRTQTGRAIRATSYDRDTSALMGINVDRTIGLTFFIGSVLAGVAGVLVAVRDTTVDPLMGVSYGLKAFIAAVLGGIGNLPGAVVGSLILGLSESYVFAYGDAIGLGSEWKDAFAFVILIVVLIVKPTGILGRDEREKV